MKTRAKTVKRRQLEKKQMMQAMLAAVWMLGAPLTAQAQAPEFVSSPVIKISESDSARARRVVLGVGKSIVIDLPRDAKEVFVANPTVANAVIRSTRKAFLIGTAAGQTSVFFLDAEGRQIAALEMDVNRDLLPVRSALRSALPNAKIQLEAIEKGVILSGSVGTPEEAARAVEIAGRFFGGADSVVNSLVIRSKDQVMLKVTVAEVQRSALKQLGVDLSGSWKVGDFGA
jgi:pilus assembly protein CpaC